MNQFYCFRKVIINTDNELKEKIECLTSKAPEKKLPSTKRKRTCDKSIKTKTPRNRRRINVIPTSNPEDDIKTEPAENDSYIGRLVICEPENIKDDKTVKQETNRDEVTDQTLDCVQCSLTFVSEKEFNIHKNSTHRKYNKKPKTLECPECNVTFSNLNQLSNHKRTTHTAPGKHFTCYLNFLTLKVEPRVKLNIKVSNEVPQGSVLGSLPFYLYISDFQSS